jgi:hypothetical protein
MTKTLLKKLVKGDVINWNDPGGECSRTAPIEKIEIRVDMVRIYWLNGDYTEALPSEISA